VLSLLTLRLYLRTPNKKRSFRLRVEDKSVGGPIDGEDAANGVPQLIKDSRIDITWEQEKASKSFAEMRHPRTRWRS
jgi:hypothetical protein